MYDRYEKMLNVRNCKTSDVCKTTGISPSTISHWKKGDYEPKRDTIQKIADFFEIPVDYFYTSYPDMFDIEQRYHRPVYEVSGGEGCINDIISEIANTAADSVIESLDEQIAVVRGDSMYPSLHDGDEVRFIPATSVDPSDFALVRINGYEVSVKHCEITDDGLWVRGENPDAFTDRFYTVSECLTLPVQIIGKAVSFERKL